MTDQDSRQVPISEAMRLALDHHQSGHLPEAEAIYRAVLEAEPEHAGATYNLALIALQGGRPQEALPALEAALEREPDNVAHWLNCAAALAGGGQPLVARQLLLQARERGLGGKPLADTLAQVQRMIDAPRPTVIDTMIDVGADQPPDK
jgi:tetratricopeptide (TPR) repeat protein